eukprot:TRINITY_DN1119_c0_g1_i4.p1 TRINITY_DN1119_c0_g1~~TRINITY_DN1119_c0_g1_i4.p1  ORF type:complete len:307 (+),score=30.07 TRINITY_DN1119_c0_g1_i4:119-1039(+)
MTTESASEHFMQWLLHLDPPVPPSLDVTPDPPHLWNKTYWSWNDVYMTFFFAFALAALRSVLAKTIFLPLGRRLIPERKQRRNLSKWEENCWFEVYYPLSTIVGFYVISTREYSNNPYYFWTNFPVQERGLDITLYYAMGFGFYFQAIFALVIWETRRKDFVEMVLHHIVTLLLLGISWTCGYERIGHVVLLLHDFVDIFLYGTKILHYLGKRFETATNISFVLFALVYLLVRMIYFPWRVIASCFWRDDFVYEQRFWVQYEPRAGMFHYSAGGICVANYCGSPFNLEVLLLCVLYCLHCFWFYLM